MPVRRRARTDDNQRDIVSAFRGLSCSVADTSAVGDGFTDLVVGLVCCGGRRHNLLVEVKDGSKSPSGRKLTPAQVDFHRDWQGRTHVVESVDDVIDLVSRLRRRGEI